MQTVTESGREAEPDGPRVDESASGLPPWGRDDLPEPLPFGARNLFKTIGPGAILLATSIGGGEWLVGPATSVQYGVGLFWIATVAILLQLVFNLEAIRYTLYTGEPIYSGFMRLRPSSNFWSTAYVILTAMQLGLPARSEEHTSELQSRQYLVCRLLLEKRKNLCTSPLSLLYPP